jgi:glycosyltransferase 2 family protein
VCGSRLVPHREIFVAVAVISLGAAITAPSLLPRLAAWLCRVTGRNIRLPQLPSATIWLSLSGTALAWIAYGLAFRLFAEGMLGNAAGSPPVLPYVAIYTGAYILGFVTPVAPAGLGIREAGILQYWKWHQGS